MSQSKNISHIIEKKSLEKVAKFFLKIYDSTIDSNSSELDDNYTENGVLYRRTYNALPNFTELNNEFIFPVKANNKPIISLTDGSIHLRFLTKSLPLWKREKDRYRRSPIELFNIDENVSHSYFLFEEDNSKPSESLFGFIWCEVSATEVQDIYVIVKIVDQYWNAIAEWSSDEIATLRPIEQDFWSDLDDAVEIDIEEIKTSAPSVGIEIDEPKIYSEEQDKKNGTKPTEK